MTSDRQVRVRTSSDRKKALAQYQELRREARVDSAVILCEMKDGSFQVLGQGLNLDEITDAILTAAQALQIALDKQNEVRPEPHQEPVKRGEHNLSKARAKEITLDADGVMVPPAGENFISCGECSHPRWYILHRNGTDLPARYACAHCGNEVKSLPIQHASGHA